MPFDLVMDDLYPTVAKMAPADRLEALRRWLDDMDPKDPRWLYEQWMTNHPDPEQPHCGTQGCAGGWYMLKVRPEKFDDFMEATQQPVQSIRGDHYSPSILMLADEFGIWEHEAAAIFARADWYAPGHVGDDRMSPQDIAYVIGMVQRGEIFPDGGAKGGGL